MRGTGGTAGGAVGYRGIAKRAFFGVGRVSRSAAEAVELLNYDKHSQRDKKKIYNCIQEGAILDRLTKQIHHQVVKIDPASEQTQKRIQNIIHQRVHNLSERGANDYGNGQIQSIALDGELFKFFPSIHHTRIILYDFPLPQSSLWDLTG